VAGRIGRVTFVQFSGLERSTPARPHGGVISILRIRTGNDATVRLPRTVKIAPVARCLSLGGDGDAPPRLQGAATRHCRGKVLVLGWESLRQRLRELATFSFVQFSGLERSTPARPFTVVISILRIRTGNDDGERLPRTVKIVPVMRCLSLSGDGDTPPRLQGAATRRCRKICV